MKLYLHGKIKASPIYYFDEVKNGVIIRLDNINYNNFFACRGTADLKIN